MSRLEQRSGIAAAAGSLLSAVTASACCWLPLLLLAFGASAGGAAAWFEQYRPLFLTGAIALLALGFYLVYRPDPVCKPGSACETPRPKLRRFNQAVVWIAAVLVAGFAFFPSYAAWFVSDTTTPPATATNGQSVTLKIDGMTCEACATGLQAQLRQTPGVAASFVNYTEGRATVTFSERTPVTMEALGAVVEKAGYRIIETPSP